MELRKIEGKDKSDGKFVCHVSNQRSSRSLANVLQNRCSYKFSKFHKKAPVLKSLLNKVAWLQRSATLLKETLNRRLPVRTHFSIE